MSSKGVGTVLVVDDEVEIREIIELYAASLGMNVLEACDGEQALEVVKNHHVDLIVSDLMMPRLSGLGLLEALRKQGSALPFIIVTGYPSRDSTVQALRFGAFDFLEKPFDRDELQKLISEAMRFSLEQQKVTPQLAGVPATDDPAVKAEQGILQLRHLRVARENNDSTLLSAADQQMCELFLAETLPQLTFCEGAILGLAQSEVRAYELGYLFRVMQAVARAAAAIGAEDIAKLAGAVERLCTMLRVKPRATDEATQGLLMQANKTLIALVEEIDHPSPTSLTYSKILAELSQTTARLEGAANITPAAS